MKVLIFLALLAVTLRGICSAQNCTADEIERLSITFSSCANNASCFLDLCGCCTEALETGISHSNYDCCLAYSSLLECHANTVPVCKDCSLYIAPVTSGSGPTDFDSFDAADCFCLPDLVVVTDPMASTTTDTITLVVTDPMASTTTDTITLVTTTAGKDAISPGLSMILAVSGVMTLLHVCAIAL